MHSYQRAIAVALATFGASVLGMALQLVVPAQVLADSRGTVGAMVGLITLLLALVLGLLVYTAFTVYTTQQAEAQGLGPVVIELDVILEEYGPDAMRGRVGLREALGRSRRRFFGDAKRGPQAHTFEETRATMHWMNTYFDSLQPSTERQRRLLISARDLAKTFAETQMLMARQLSNPFPPHLLVVVVLWASLLFSRQRPRRRPERSHGLGASLGRDRHRLRGFSHSGAEPSLFGRDPPFLRSPRPATPLAWGPSQAGGVGGRGLPGRARVSSGRRAQGERRLRGTRLATHPRAR